MRYLVLSMVMLFVTLTALAVNVWMGLAFGNPVNWAACVFIAPLALFQLVVCIRMATR